MDEKNNMKKVRLLLILFVSGLLLFLSASSNDAEIPKLYLDGNISEMYEKPDVRSISFEYQGGDYHINGFAEIKVQGNSSLKYEKKNYTIKFYTDPDHHEKLKINLGWGPQSKYCLKANWIDKTHARNVVSAKLVTQVQQKYNVLPNAPRNGAIDGFPIEIYSNGEFLGLYTFNIPKDAWQFGMDSNNPNHIVICAEGWEPANVFWGEPDFQTWSVEVGEENEETLEKIKDLFSFVMNSSDLEFKENFEKHLDLDAALNYYVLSDFAYLTDNISKNMLLVTYDGVKWYPCLYDMDTSWGTSWEGDSVHDYENERVKLWINRLFYRMENCFEEDLIERYFELRKSVLTRDHVLEEFNAFNAMIPADSFEKEKNRWGSEIPGYDYLQIEEYLDTVLPILDDKYNDWTSWKAERDQLLEDFFRTYSLSLESE